MKSYKDPLKLETRANDAVFVPAEGKCGCSHPGSYPISFCTLHLHKEFIILTLSNFSSTLKGRREIKEKRENRAKREKREQRREEREKRREREKREEREREARRERE
jgi:hypothetical protein